MILILSAVSLAAGTTLSCVLERFPTQKIAMERCSGLMVVTGLALIGGGLPLFR
ncbi:hypothetical protein [Beijerinckia sp. L45]|uniref:hypothetical protein n=1 Tax=Beijerinckia sp. L45 TaxID=1641855 RepID=UPI00131E781D|nr:hypothetical protein [Beijerinckia sp. L45]